VAERRFITPHSNPHLADSPPTPCEKGRCPIISSASPSITVRKELQEYSWSCEQLLSSTALISHAPLSTDEQEILQYYQEELKARLLNT
jgi:hypothetical protein